MARASNKTKALAYAAEHGITLTAEDRDNFDGDYAVEVWSLNSHLSEPNSYCHTYFARGNTEARAWADALAYMLRLTECPADCSCRDQGRAVALAGGVPGASGDQDDDTWWLVRSDRNHSNEAEVWVCECCALLITNGDDSGCRDFHNHTHPTCDKSVTCADMESTFEVGYFYANCNGCGEIVRTGGTLYAAIRLTSN